MKKIISIILALVILTSCVAVGTINSSAATYVMKTKTTMTDKKLYEGMESHMVVGLNCGGDYFRIDDLRCMQKYISYKSSNTKKAFVTVSGKIVCFDDASSVRLTSYLKLPSNAYEFKYLLSSLSKENYWRYLILNKFLQRGKTVTSSVNVRVYPLKLEGFANYYGATAHKVNIKSTTANTITLNLTSTSKKKANGLIAITTPCASTLRWKSSNVKVLDGRYQTNKPGVTIFAIQKANFNGTVKIYIKDRTGNTLRTIKINHKYII